MFFAFLYVIIVAKTRKDLNILAQNEDEVKMVMTAKEPMKSSNSSFDEEESFQETNIDELCEDLESLSF